MNALDSGQNSPLSTQTSGRSFQSLSDAPGQVVPGHQYEPSPRSVSYFDMAHTTSRPYLRYGRGGGATEHGDAA